METRFDRFINWCSYHLLEIQLLSFILAVVALTMSIVKYLKH